MGVQDEIRKLVGTQSARHKRLVEYVVRQIRRNGRDLDAVLEDPYVTNRLSALERRALLEEPGVVEAAREDILARMRARMEALAEK